MQLPFKFYRVHYKGEPGTSSGFEWYTSLETAKRRARDFKRQHEGIADTNEATTTIEVIKITPTKAGILAALNSYAAHPDNG